MSERDKALIDEAVRRADSADNIREACRIALDLERSGWQPTVDPDVLAVREILEAAATVRPAVAAAYRDGSYDKEPFFQDALAAYRKHKGGANAAD